MARIKNGLNYHIQFLLNSDNLARNFARKVITSYRAKRFPSDMDDDFKEIYCKCKDYTMTSIERMYALYKSVQYVIDREIPGDFVECGVWKGGSTMIIAHTLLKMKEQNRKIYLYDTYEGMTKPTEKDKIISGSLDTLDLWEKHQKNGYNGLSYSPLDEVKKNMHSTGYPQKQLVFIKGKVEDTIPEVIPEQIALLRLDTDWYASTYHELKHLYKLLSNRGVLIIDDYGYCAGSKEAVDRYFKKNKINVLLNRIDSSGRVCVKL